MCYFTRMEDTALIPVLSNQYIPPLTGGAYSPIIMVMGLWKAKRGGREGKKRKRMVLSLQVHVGDNGRHRV